MTTTAEPTDVQALQQRIAALEAELRFEQRCSENLRAMLDQVPDLGDPYDFRRWLASLPPDRAVRMRKRDEIRETYLRARGAADAALIESGDDDEPYGRGFQTYRACGIVEEVPGWVFYSYDEWEPGWTARQGLEWFDGWMREYWGEMDLAWEPEKNA